MTNNFSKSDVKKTLKKLGVNLNKVVYTFNDVYYGINVELEHGTRYKKWNVTDDDIIITTKIAMAHFEEHPYYYRGLKSMEELLDNIPYPRKK